MGKKLKDFDDRKKYRGFEVNVNGETYKLILQLSPFEIYYFQDNELFMSMNSDQLMYFENLRDKEGQEQQEEPKKEQEVVEHEKEIVGYWEDGLAIYKDGTR